jgi:DNA-binding NarL/FixJ family response regulator
MAYLNFIIVDDNDIFRSGIKFYLEKMLSHNVIQEFGNGEDFLKSTNYNKADIILMDIEMPKINGIQAAKNILWEFPELKIIAITNYQEKAYLNTLIKAGFKGCVFKNNIYDDLEIAIKSVMRNQMFFPENIKIIHEEEE